MILEMFLDAHKLMSVLIDNKYSESEISTVHQYITNKKTTREIHKKQVHEKNTLGTMNIIKKSLNTQKQAPTQEYDGGRRLDRQTQ